MWLITFSERHYPCGGTRDWRELSPNRDIIMTAWANKEPSDQGTWYLIRIDVDGGYFQVETK